MAITRDDVVEARARALATADANLMDPEHYTALAEATMQADDAQGLASVPKVATWHMTHVARARFISATGTKAPSHQLVERSVNAAIAAGNLLTVEKHDG